MKRRRRWHGFPVVNPRRTRRDMWRIADQLRPVRPAWHQANAVQNTLRMSDDRFERAVDELLDIGDVAVFTETLYADTVAPLRIRFLKLTGDGRILLYALDSGR